MVSHGEGLHIPEILARGLGANNLSVRVLGTLVHMDTVAARLAIEHQSARLEVDTSALEARVYQQGQLLQFIGEMVVCEHAAPLLRARIVRDMDIQDLDLYDRSLKAKRDFERELARARSAAI